MEKETYFSAVGVMSGTSMDGIDVSLLVTNGQNIASRKKGACFAYTPSLQKALREIIQHPDEALNALLQDLTDAVTHAHCAAVQTYLAGAKVDLIGFHGQTIAHAPLQGKTRQLFNGALAAKLLKTKIVCDFRSNDMRHGGQGAPLVPIYHQVLAQEFEKPVAFVNLGGVANITYIDNHALIAFDTGPASALIDDFMLKRQGLPFDKGGQLALSGKIHYERVEAAMQHAFFTQLPPKSLDRNAFTLDVSDLSDADGAATLTAFTVASLLKALELLPHKPRQLILCGGGVHNKALTQGLSYPYTLAQNSDFIESECFALLAVRRVLGLPMSFPTTTGVTEPLTGGEIHLP